MFNKVKNLLIPGLGIFFLAACGGVGGTVSMAGDWTSKQSIGGADYLYILDISGPDEAFTGELKSEVFGTRNTLASFDGSRDGNTVTIAIFGNSDASYTGTLSGNRLSFDDFVTSASTGPITFTK